jgi:hypothetical protein
MDLLMLMKWDSSWNMLAQQGKKENFSINWTPIV